MLLEGLSFQFVGPEFQMQEVLIQRVEAYLRERFQIKLVTVVISIVTIIIFKLWRKMHHCLFAGWGSIIHAL